VNHSDAVNFAINIKSILESLQCIRILLTSQDTAVETDIDWKK